MFNGFCEFSGGYNLHQFSDAIGLVSVCYSHILGSAIT